MSEDQLQAFMLLMFTGIFDDISEMEQIRRETIKIEDMQIAGEKDLEKLNQKENVVVFVMKNFILKTILKT